MYLFIIHIFIFSVVVLSSGYLLPYVLSAFAFPKFRGKLKIHCGTFGYFCLEDLYVEYGYVVVTFKSIGISSSLLDVNCIKLLGIVCIGCTIQSTNTRQSKSSNNTANKSNGVHSKSKRDYISLLTKIIRRIGYCLNISLVDTKLNLCLKRGKLSAVVSTIQLDVSSWRERLAIGVDVHEVSIVFDFYSPDSHLKNGLSFHGLLPSCSATSVSEFSGNKCIILCSKPSELTVHYEGTNRVVSLSVNSTEFDLNLETFECEGFIDNVNLLDESQGDGLQILYCQSIKLTSNQGAADTLNVVFQLEDPNCNIFIDSLLYHQRRINQILCKLKKNPVDIQAKGHYSTKVTRLFDYLSFKVYLQRGVFAYCSTKENVVVDIGNASLSVTIDLESASPHGNLQIADISLNSNDSCKLLCWDTLTFQFSTRGTLKLTFVISNVHFNVSERFYQILGSVVNSVLSSIHDHNFEHPAVAQLGTPHLAFKKKDYQITLEVSNVTLHLITRCTTIGMNVISTHAEAFPDGTLEVVVLSLSCSKMNVDNGKEVNIPMFVVQDLSASIKSIEVESVDPNSVGLCRKIELEMYSIVAHWCPVVHHLVINHVALAVLALDLTPAARVAKKKVGRSSMVIDVSFLTTAEIVLHHEPRASNVLLFQNLSITSSFPDLYLHATTKSIDVCFDDHLILNVQDGDLIVSHSGAEVGEVKYPRSELNNAGSTFSPDAIMNKTIKVSVKLIEFEFPSNYVFYVNHRAIMTSLKLVKTLHNVSAGRQSPKTDSSPFYDLLLSADRFTVKLPDDRFESKISELYQLRVDESVEEVKRTVCFEEEWDAFLESQHSRRDILKQACSMSDKYDVPNTDRVSLASEKMCDHPFCVISRKRRAKSCEIMIERLAKLKASSPEYRTLLDASFYDVTVNIFADACISGRKNVLGVMTALNPESPLDEGKAFSALRCRYIVAGTKAFRIGLRDYPLPLLFSSDVHISGLLVLAEAEGLSSAKRRTTVHIGGTSMFINRNLAPLKYYSGLKVTVGQLSVAYGMAFHPAICLLQSVLENINKPSSDPSKSLPSFDKYRLVFHGSIELNVCDGFELLYLATFDPYNTNEALRLRSKSAEVIWTNGRLSFIFHLLTMKPKTCSKYDVAELLIAKVVEMYVELLWQTKGNPNDHHSVALCYPENVPRHIATVLYDSYRDFRSQSVDVNLNISITDGESMVFTSTPKWVKDFLDVMTSPLKVRRGPLFNKRPKPVKAQFFKHIARLNVGLDIKELSLSYWSSQYSNGRGLELTTNYIQLLYWKEKLSPDNSSTKSKFDTKLKVDLHKLAVKLSSHVDSKTQRGAYDDYKSFFFSLNSLVYEKATGDYSRIAETAPNSYDHKLKIRGLRVSWNKNNKELLLGLYKWSVDHRNMRADLSNNALKIPATIVREFSNLQEYSSAASQDDGLDESPGRGERLIEDMLLSHLLDDVAREGFSETVSHQEDSCRNGDLFDGVINPMDISYRKLEIEILDSQVCFQAPRMTGCIIATSSEATVRYQSHHTILCHGRYFNKNTWVGILSGVQYFCSDSDVKKVGDANIPWLEDPVIGDSTQVKIGNGFQTVHRITNHCSCRLHFAVYKPYTDSLTTDALTTKNETTWYRVSKEEQTPVDTISILHDNIVVSTTALQFQAIENIINNLLLDFDPSNDRVQQMRLESPLTDTRTSDILELQETIRENLFRIKDLEWRFNKVVSEKGDSSSMGNPGVRLTEAKLLNRLLSEKLHFLVSRYKEGLLSEVHQATNVASSIQIARRNDIRIANCKWNLLKDDLPSVLAEIELRDFVYNRNFFMDGLAHHSFVVGYLSVIHLNHERLTVQQSFQPEKTVTQDKTKAVPSIVLKPTMLTDHADCELPMQREPLLRIELKSRPPVNGISIKEMLHVDIAPLALKLNRQFMTEAQEWLFPGTHDTSSDGQGLPGREPQDGTSLLPVDELPPVLESPVVDWRKIKRPDASKLAFQRRTNHHCFKYIRIGRCDLTVSYSDNDSKFKHIRNMLVQTPDLVYRDKNCTWRSLTIVVKKDVYEVIIREVIKQALHIKGLFKEKVKDKTKARAFIVARNWDKTAEAFESKKTEHQSGSSEVV